MPHADGKDRGASVADAPRPSFAGSNFMDRIKAL
jgi:hypothetical protein